MDITITLNESDLKLLDGFCNQTRWNAKLGVTQEDWMTKKVTEWVTQQARQGLILNSTTAERTAYQTAMKAAIAQAGTDIKSAT